MSWGKLLQPDLTLRDSVIALTTEMVTQHQLKGLVLDVDETLVPITTQQISQDLHHWIESLRPLVSLWLVSNNISHGRIATIGAALNVPYISGAGKPSRRKLRRAVEAMGLPADRVGMVGDRLFTDVLAGNRLGMFTILVEPMVDPLHGNLVPSTRSLEVWISKTLGASLPFD